MKSGACLTFNFIYKSAFCLFTLTKNVFIYKVVSPGTWDFAHVIFQYALQTLHRGFLTIERGVINGSNLLFKLVLIKKRLLLLIKWVEVLFLAHPYSAKLLQTTSKVGSSGEVIILKLKFTLLCTSFCVKLIKRILFYRALSCERGGSEVKRMETF